MKKLLLIRHAKAVHETSYSDFERPLKHSGQKDAETMAKRLKKESIIPQLLITSPALRAKNTATIFSEQLSLSKPKEDKQIYEAGERDLLHIINELPDEHEFIGLAGHNPGIAQIIHYLTGHMVDVPTCAVALIEFEFDKWKLLSEDTGKLTWFSSPKES
jgi:phosphohistidine phosphatase